ncbi:MAG: N-formylglutamate amidohydrolase, partial [Pseudomonadota bacterium]
CAPVIESVVAGICAGAEGYSSVLNGRFKGGWTTRHYGRPGEKIHAIQMELAQSTHLVSETRPYDFDVEKAGRLRVHLKTILNSVADLAASLGGRS